MIWCACRRLAYFLQCRSMHPAFCLPRSPSPRSVPARALRAPVRIYTPCHVQNGCANKGNTKSVTKVSCAQAFIQQFLGQWLGFESDMEARRQAQTHLLAFAHAIHVQRGCVRDGHQHALLRQSNAQLCLGALRARGNQCRAAVFTGA